MKAIILAAAASALVVSAAAAEPYGYAGQGGYTQGGYQQNGYSHHRRHHHGYGQTAYDQGANGQHSGWGRDYGSDHQWQNGQRMGYNDWQSSRAVDYRSHHLRQPPYGYEWRESNGRYVMAAIATGLIASMIYSSNH